MGDICTFVFYKKITKLIENVWAEGLFKKIKNLNITANLIFSKDLVK